MECPDCGYHIPPFDKECLRCKRLGADARQKRCPACGKLAPLPAVACEGCGHAYRPRLTEPPRSDALPTPPSNPPPPYAAQAAAPDDPSRGSDSPDLYNPNLYGPNLPVANPPVVNVFLSNPFVSAPASSRPGGWWVALMVLLATPFGWIGLIVLLIVLVLTLRIVLVGLPIIAATLAVLAVARLDGARLDPAKKPALIAGLLALGFVANAAFWWAAVGRPGRNAPAAPSSAPASDMNRPSRHLFLRRLLQRQ